MSATTERRIGQECPVHRAGCVHGLECERHFNICREGQQLIERRTEQPAGVTKGVIVATAGIDHQAAGLHAGRQSQRILRVVDALFERAAVAAGEPAGPQQIGNRESAVGQ